MTYNEAYSLGILPQPRSAATPPTFATPAPASTEMLDVASQRGLESVLLHKYPYSMRPTLANAKANGVSLTPAEQDAYNRVGQSLI